jgi:hypothetical protein
MICLPTCGGWQIIYHRAHALLAAEIAQHWRAEFRPARWVETLTAISTHDDLEREWESDDHLTEAGTPRDFRLPGAPMNLEGKEEVSTTSQYRSRWVALLNSMHQSFLNEPQRKEDRVLDSYLKEQEENRAQWRRELRVSKTEAENAYALFQWCDRLSLILCLDELPNRERALEISVGPDGERYDILQRDDGSVTVTPWPFEAREFSLSIETRILKQARFEDNAVFLDALREARVTAKEWLFSQKAPRQKPDADFTPRN